MHLAEAELMFSELEKAGVQTDDHFRNLFRLGSLLPDTKLKDQKASSHFWSPEDRGKLALGPDLNRFRSLYGDCLKGPLMLGYYVHLHLDTGFVQDFWKKEFSFLDDEGREQELRSAIKWVRLLQNGKVIPVDDFFSIRYYYGDYSRMNRHFLNAYHLVLPEYEERAECPVREVNYGDLKKVLMELRLLAQGAYDLPGDQTLQVFDRDALEAFIRKSVLEILPDLLVHLGEGGSGHQHALQI